MRSLCGRSPITCRVTRETGVGNTPASRSATRIGDHGPTTDLNSKLIYCTKIEGCLIATILVTAPWRLFHIYKIGRPVISNSYARMISFG
jgi:hypothetical protein